MSVISGMSGPVCSACGLEVLVYEEALSYASTAVDLIRKLGVSYLMASHNSSLRPHILVA